MHRALRCADDVHRGVGQTVTGKVRKVEMREKSIELLGDSEQE